MSQSTAPHSDLSVEHGLTLGDLATRFGCEVSGDPDAIVQRVATLALAGPGDLSFLANTKYRRFLATTSASAVVLVEDAVSDCPTNALVASDPYLTYARIAQVLYPSAGLPGGRHPAAWCDPTAQIAQTATEPKSVNLSALGPTVWSAKTASLVTNLSSTPM